MTQPETLSLHFLSLPPRRNYLRSPPPPGDRVVLPVLTRFKYRGISKYLDSLVAIIDAPRLGDIDVTFFNQPTLDALQLGLFVNRTEMRKSPLRAEIIFYVDSISITFTQPGAFTRLGLQISCEQLDWQLFSISQICDHFSSLLFNVENLGIMTIGPSSVPDDMDDEQWQGHIRVFDGAKDFRVVGKFATEIMHALRPADREHNTILPSLRNLHVQPMYMHGPLKDSIESFVIRRRLSSHPVQIKSPSIGRPMAEEVESAKRQVQVQKRSAFDRFRGVVGGPPVPNNANHEYIRNLEYLDMGLGNIKRYIHIAFGALKDEDVRKMFTMMAPTKFQLEESKKPKPRYVLDLRTIRGMIQEADHMYQRLTAAALGVRSAVPHQQ
ncbi:hypothetical protein EDB87DRAFT_915041 [Lactarius vividus]|nr:hypothetical protein EDB87DRAFT_978566 [Lactarius vividus]KAH9058316.1 hypothetical protein EDB87DRAFT_915041 [Lactarius vividus]